MAPSVCVAVFGNRGDIFRNCSGGKTGQVGGSPDYGLLHRDRGNAVLLAGAGVLLLFTVQLPIFPIGFSVPVGMAADEVSLADRLYHAFLPACTLGLTGISSIAMHTREKVIEILESDYVLYARARGESGWRLIFRHGLRNLLLPVITLQFGSISEIFGGSVLVEQVFSYPGLGQAAVTAGLGSDIPLLMGITLISAVLVFAGNAAADGLYRLVDPRLRKGGRA